jgi:hypothetical protein
MTSKFKKALKSSIFETPNDTRGYLPEFLERENANAKVAKVLGITPESYDTVESEGLLMKQC